MTKQAGRVAKFEYLPPNGLSTGNYVLQKKDFYISFNKNPGGMISMFKAETDKGETALVHNEKGQDIYRILNGDFRKEYGKLANKGFKACLAFYEANKEKHGSSWTTPTNKETV